MTQLESRKRSWVKSLAWRVIGLILLAAIVYWVTGNWEEMTVITLIFHGVRVVLYYFHERIWDQITWGRVVKLADLTLKRPLTPEDQNELEGFLQKRGYLEAKRLMPPRSGETRSTASPTHLSTSIFDLLRLLCQPH
jgi:uncharacterized membrane protein